MARRCAHRGKEVGHRRDPPEQLHLSTRPGDATDPPAVTPFVVSEARLATASGAWTCSIYNTHLGHLPWTARLMAEDLLGRLDRWWNGATQIVTGDFNALPGGSVVEAMVAPPRRSPTFRGRVVSRRGDAQGSAGTFHWGRGLPGPRLDYDLRATGRARSLCDDVDRRIGRDLPSDHAALTVELALTAPGLGVGGDHGVRPAADRRRSPRSARATAEAPRRVPHQAQDPPAHEHQRRRVDVVRARRRWAGCAPRSELDAHRTRDDRPRPPSCRRRGAPADRPAPAAPRPSGRERCGDAAGIGIG